MNFLAGAVRTSSGFSNMYGFGSFGATTQQCLQKTSLAACKTCCGSNQQCKNRCKTKFGAGTTPPPGPCKQGSCAPGFCISATGEQCCPSDPTKGPCVNANTMQCGYECTGGGPDGQTMQCNYRCYNYGPQPDNPPIQDVGGGGIVDTSGGSSSLDTSPSLMDKVQPFLPYVGGAVALGVLYLIFHHHSKAGRA